MRWRPPTRPLILIALLLLAGAVVNVAVAWGLASQHRRVGTTSFDVNENRPFPVFPETRHWPRCEWVRQSRVIGSDWTLYERYATASRDKWYVSVLRSGWPARSLRSYEGEYVGYSDARQQPLAQPAWLGVSHLPASVLPFVQADTPLPLDPLLPGFAINTLFYAVVVGAILALPLSFFPIRRRVRARRGRCPKCGYPAPASRMPPRPAPSVAKGVAECESGRVAKWRSGKVRSRAEAGRG